MDGEMGGAGLKGKTRLNRRKSAVVFGGGPV